MLLAVAIAISASGVVSIIKRGPLNAEESRATAHGPASPAGLDPVAVATASELDAGERRAAGHRVFADAAHAAEVDAAEPPASRRASGSRRGGSSGRRLHRALMSAARAELLVSGRIATLGGRLGPGWVSAMAVTGGRVIATGSRDDLEGFTGPGTRRLRLAPDEVAIPGLTDAHLHLAEAALARLRVNLEGAASIEAIGESVRAAAAVEADAGAWIEGAGWDADLLERWPTASDLEAAAPGRLVALWAHDHHALLASARALTEAGIDRDRGDPDGGVIRRDESGRPTGVLHETAARLVAGLIPPPDADRVSAALRPMIRELVSLGVVAAHDPGGLSERRDLGGPLEAYRRLAADGALGMRVHPCLRPEQLDAAEAVGLRSGRPLGPDPLGRLRLGWLKTFADGSLGSRTAALLEPLDRLPGEPVPPNEGYGVWLTTPDELRAQAARAASLGIATQIHGIGDAGVRAALDALAPTVGMTPLMPRVEHVQLVSTADIPRFAALGIAASVQPVHVRSDAAEGPPALGRPGGGAWVCAGGAGPVRGGHADRDGRAGGARRPVARRRLCGHAVRAVLAGRDAPLRARERARPLARHPRRVRGPRDQRRRDGPWTPCARTSGGHRRAVRGGARRARRGGRGALERAAAAGAARWGGRRRGLNSVGRRARNPTPATRAFVSGRASAGPFVSRRPWPARAGDAPRRGGSPR